MGSPCTTVEASVQPTGHLDSDDATLSATRACCADCCAGAVSGENAETVRSAAMMLLYACPFWYVEALSGRSARGATFGGLWVYVTSLVFSE